MAAESPVDFVRQNEERFRLLVYFIAIAGLAFPLADLFRRGWYAGPGNVTRTSITSLSRLGVGLGTVQAVAFGLVAGLLTLLVLDQKKRVQGLLLWIGLVLVGVGFVILGSVPRLLRDPGANLLGAGIGLAVVALVAVPGSIARSFARLQRPISMEFPRAPKLLWALTTVTIGAFWLEAHAFYPALLQTALDGGLVTVDQVYFRWTSKDLLADSVAGVAFVGLTRRFMRYEATTSVMIIGPSNAGKTYTMYGAYLEWRLRRNSADKDPMDPSQDMRRRRDEAETIDQAVTDGGTDLADEDVIPWTLESTTSGLEELSFSITEGDVFPMTKTITSLDHTGEALPAIVDLISGTPPEEVSEVPDEVAAALHRHVEEADTLVFLLDVERIVDKTKELETAPYTDIIQEYRDEKQLLFAATKADLLEYDYNDMRQREAYKRENLDDFAEFVTEELTNQSGLLRGMIEDGGAASVHPIYIMTEEYNGERYPIEQGGSIQPFGYVRLLEKVR